jgi:hypothetical protein
MDTSAEFNAVAVDAAGDIYAAGNIWGPGSIDFGNGVTATAEADGDGALLVKYDASGVAQWVQTIAAGSGHSEFSSVAVDSKGDVYVAGYVGDSTGVVDFGGGVTQTKMDASMSALLAEYDASGHALSARLIDGDSADSVFSAVAVDPADNVYAAGSISGTATYDFGNAVTATGVLADGSADGGAKVGVLVKYDSSGPARWAATLLQAPSQSEFGAVAVNGAGEVYCAGSITGDGSYDFGHGVTVTGSTTGGGPVAGQLGTNALLVKYDASGSAVWARVTTADQSSVFASVALDSRGAVYAAGSIQEGSYDFGDGVSAQGSVQGGSFTGTAGDQFLVLAKYDGSGVAQWARTVNPGGSNSYLNAVAVDAADDVYIAGAIDATGTYDFGNGVSLPTGDRGTDYYMALVKYDPSGAAHWARSVVNDGSTSDIVSALAFDSAGNTYAAGIIGGTGTVDFGNGVSMVEQQIDAGSGWSPLLLKYQ